MQPYKPKIIEIDQYVKQIAYAAVIIRLRQCSGCGRWMVVCNPEKSRSFFSDTVDEFMCWEAQMARTDWVYQSYIRDKKGWPLCQECAAQDKGSFTCHLCGQERPSSHLKEKIAMDIPFCTDCYETVSAKVWLEAIQQIEKEQFEDY